MAQNLIRPGARRAVLPLLETPHYEVVPLNGALEQAAFLPAGAVATVTTTPSRGTEATISLVEALAARGFRPVPHLAARQIADEEELGSVLQRLDAAGVRGVFVVGGDASVPAGPFADGLALLRAIHRAGAPFDTVGVPSYPEGHHAIDDATLWASLEAKQEYATYTVTQLCFDADRVCAFAAEAKRRGIVLPVRVGIAGVVDAAHLLRVSMRIGIGDSTRFLRGNASGARRLLNPFGYRPDALVRKLAGSVRQGRCQLAGLHVYTFNHVDPTVRWMQQAHRRAA